MDWFHSGWKPPSLARLERLLLPQITQQPDPAQLEVEDLSPD